MAALDPLALPFLIAEHDVGGRNGTNRGATCRASPVDLVDDLALQRDKPGPCSLPAGFGLGDRPLVLVKDGQLDVEAKAVEAQSTQPLSSRIALTSERAFD